MTISVIICTYNPEEHIFSRCLNAVAAASIISSPAEILIIDNNSSFSLDSKEYISAFVKNEKNARIIIEKKQGLTPARLKGIEEATGELLIFIDDDNVIEQNFFQAAAQIAASKKMIGAFSGQVLLDFETEPPVWTKRYWGLLVYREFSKDLWSNLPHLFETMPCGAGLCVRKEVGAYYLQLHKDGKRKVQLDRSGNSLFSGGDNDLSACACDIGLGIGLFSSLKVYHIIPPKRLKKTYLLNLSKGIAASSVVFKSFRGEYSVSPGLKRNIANQVRSILKNKLERDFFAATLEGEAQGRELLKKMGK